MKRSAWTTAVAVGAVLAGAGPGAAQVAWDSPFLVAPNTPRGGGIFLMETDPGDGIGVMATWRGSAAPGGLGFRVGLAEDARDDVAAFGGADWSGWIIQANDDFHLDLIWTTGVGLGIGDDVLISAPLGVALGRQLESDGIWFNPWVSPRLVLDAFLGDEDPPGDDEDLELRLAVDLGFDVSFDSRLAIRFGATVGDREALAIGLNFPGVDLR